MSDQTKALTNMNPKITKFQTELRNQFTEKNKSAKKGQIVFVGSSTTEIFPIEKLQMALDLDKVIYNRGVRATTTADLLKYIDVCIFDLEPSKVFINIGSNDIGFNVPESEFLANYDEILRLIKEKLPHTQVYVMKFFPVNPVADFGEPQDEHDSLFKTRTNDTLNAASEKIAKLAQKYGDEFINANQGLTDADGNLRKELTFDGGHMLPSGDGYKIVLHNLEKYLD